MKGPGSAEARRAEDRSHVEEEAVRLEDLEPALQIVRQGGRMIEGVRVEPDPCGAGLPGVLDGLGQKMTTKAASMKLSEQSEIGDLNAPVDVAAQFEISGGRSPHGQKPDRHCRIGQVRPDFI